MTLNLISVSPTLIAPDPDLVEYGSPYKYSITLHGDVEEWVCGIVGVDQIAAIEKNGPEEMLNKMLHTTYGRIKKPVREGYDSMFRLPAWKHVLETGHECGTLVNDKLSAYVSDQNGNVVYKFDDVVRRVVKQGYEENDHETASYDPTCSADEADFGIINLSLRGEGATQFDIECEDGFDPSKLHFDLNATPTYMTDVIYYDGNVLNNVDHTIYKDQGATVAVFGVSTRH